MTHEAPAPVGDGNTAPSPLLSRVRKTIASGIATLALVGGALTDVSDGGSTITGTEWSGIAIAAVGTVVVFFIPNAD